MARPVLIVQRTLAAGIILLSAFSIACAGQASAPTTFTKGADSVAATASPIVAAAAIGTIPPTPAGTPQGTPSATATSAATFTDPFAYCAAVGTIDTPDARYTGAKVPESIARGLMRAVNASPNAPLEQFVNASFWRCMGGKVYACTVGANLPCESKASTSREPNSAMVDFCRMNRDSDFIPAVATGRTTVYQWRCQAGAPSVVRQVTQPDPRGFIASLWHEISRP